MLNVDRRTEEKRNILTCRAIYKTRRETTVNQQYMYNNICTGTGTIRVIFFKRFEAVQLLVQYIQFMLCDNTCYSALSQPK